VAAPPSARSPSAWGAPIELRPGGPAALLAPCTLRLAWGRRAQRAEGLRFVALDHAPELLFEAEQLAACVYARFLLCEHAHGTLEDAGFQPLAVTDEGYPSAMVKLLRRWSKGIPEK
jgi:hypothetical protein